MRLGVSLSQAGRCADPASIRAAATAAEQVGYASLWVADRPPASRALGVAGDGDGRGPTPTDGPPEDIVALLDPVNVLAYAAAVTARVRLGTSVLVAPWYRPALLARSLASLDVLSDGRLTVGLGLGWTLDDHRTVGVPQHERGLDDALDSLGTAWRGHGRARPPVVLAAYTPAGLDRVARRADGWNPAGLPVDMLAPMWASVRDLAAGHGRDPDALELVVRADVEVTDAPLDGERPPYHGTVEQVAADIADTRRAGAHEVILALRGDPCLDQALDLYARLAESIDTPAPA
jgi:alkanesulfonate monooxygenase SsuD/methylene tetrahydromethanopterin reductase-like flavin-dependent oxidoreductase (luciferase family)